MTRTLGTQIEVGTSLPELVLPPITRATLALYAGASGDHNPMHIDLDTARAAGSEDVFAHGMLSAAYLGRLLSGWVPQQQIRSLSMRFVAITPVLSRPTCSGTVVAIEEADGERRARVALEVRLENGTTSLTGEAVVALS
jgi:acyl dehydratase